MAMVSNPKLTQSRYTDIQGEPIGKLLVPIKGYQNEPLLPLEEAVKPIQQFFNNLEEHVWIAKENCQTPKDDLTQDEAAAIHLYTMQFDSGESLYQVLNRTLRAENRDGLKSWFLYLKLFLTALHKLPSQPQTTVWRGVRNVDLSEKYKTAVRFALELWLKDVHAANGRLLA
ncbi:unnamed protein product [Didymodactylos carnosus]|uniref:NAD(P)(+)--arginine ADP-ribosyltransferase n=1 Tax=Didymodactylos carnosus TaxID=1234261 RepID=A0A814Z3P2_9BILA|nr:unnamed protein product [Didymodactylos carnosus]CAF3999995.1 unnamed protein product [Didymodactylos carnosus]